MKKRTKKNKGITLIALVVTVVVIIIIAGISISSLSGQDNALTSGNSTRAEANVKEEKSALEVSIQETQNSNSKGKIEEESFRTYLDQHIGTGLYDLTYNSSSDSYVVTLVRTGNTYTVTTDGEVLDGEVKLPTISLNTTSAMLAWNQTLQLEATKDDGNGNTTSLTDGIWKSSDLSVATVDSNGLVTAQEKSGNVSITIEKSGMSAECHIIVNNPVTNVVLSDTDIVIDKSVDPNFQVTASYEPSNADYGTTLTYSTDNESVAIVDNTGKITGINNGTTTLTVSSANGKTATANITVQSSPTGVEINRDNAIIDLSSDITSVDLTATTTPTDANVNTGITWSSSNSNIVAISGSGSTVTAIAKGAGTATITAKTENGKTATCTITVIQTIKNISVSSQTGSSIIDLSTSKTLQLNATTDPAVPSEGIKWTSSNTNIAEVNSSGLVTGKTNGETTITVTSDSEKATATFKVTVQTSPTGISIDKSKIALDINGTKVSTITATIYPSTANVNTELTWTSSNTNVATVTGNGATGTVTAVNSGNATISVKTKNGISAQNGTNAQCAVVVTKSITSLSVGPTSGTIDLSSSSKTIQLSVTKNPSDTTEGVTWSSNNTNVATVNSAGLVTGVSNGTATITVKSSSGNKSATSIITVQTSPTGISISPTGLTLDINGTKTGKLNATIAPSNANVNNGISWTTSNSSIVTVDGSGNVTAVGKGTATITATTSNGKTATCTVVVTKSMTSISVSPTSGTIDLATSTKTLQLSVTKNPSDTTEGVTWSSTNTNVATVSSSGLVTGKGLGTAIITVSSSSKKVSAQATITVKSSISAYISLASKTTTSIKVNASGGNSNSKYTYQISTDNNTWTTKSSNSTSTSYTYSGLSNYTVYYTRVIVSDGAGTSKTSSSINTRTYCPGTGTTCTEAKTTTSKCPDCSGTGKISGSTWRKVTNITVTQVSR